MNKRWNARRILLVCVIACFSVSARANEGVVIEEEVIGHSEGVVRTLVSFNALGAIRAIGIKSDDGFEKWIYPKNGPTLSDNQTRSLTIDELKARWANGLTGFSKEQIVGQGAGDLSISDSGRKIYFVRYGIFSDAMFEYSLESRRLRKIGKVARP